MSARLRLLARVIAWSVEHTLIVLGVTAMLGAAGVVAMLRTPVDAIPDLSDVQVIVMTDWTGQDPQLVEDQITYPIETELLKVPHTKVVRGMSQFGVSAVYVVFEDGTDLYWARSRVLEYLNGIQSKLPSGVMPMLGPDATGVGWVMQYIVADTTGTRTLADLRTIQDFTIKPALTAVPGVAEIASFGGFEKEYQIEVDPAKLLAYGLSITQVADAVRATNQDVGGRSLEMGGSEIVVGAHGRFASIDDIRAVTVETRLGGVPVTVGDVATVGIGPALRRGIADLNGRGEVVTGWVVMRYGENPRAVIDGVKRRMATLALALPRGVTFVDGYDRSGLIARAIATLRGKLLEESLIVALIALIFLLQASSALVAIVTLPLAIAMAFLTMRALGITANIMSLGGIAIAIGAMVDAAIVMVENLHRHIERDALNGVNRPRAELVIEAAGEVGPSLFISLLIITVSFLPVFALTNQEGRLLKPLAWTKTLAMAWAALLSITLVPVMMRLFIRGAVRAEGANPVNRTLVAIYRPVIRFVLRHRWATIGATAVVLVATILPWRALGSEFMPALNEGSIMDMPSLFPGVGPNEAKVILQQRDAALARIPEVSMVLGKIGRAETATDMAPMSMIETIAILKDRGDWRPGVTYDSIVREANATVRTLGVANMWSMPIKNRQDMLATGIKTPVGIKIFGPDLARLDSLGAQFEAVLSRVPGTSAVFAERALGATYLNAVVNREAAARYGIAPDAVQTAIATAVGGMNAGQVIDGRERFGVLVRYPRELRDDPERVGDVLISGANGVQVPLRAVARLVPALGPTQIKSENASLNTVVYVDVRDRDIGSYVADARRAVAASLALPPGYRVEWSGQYESLERASHRLLFIVPVTLLLIALLLYANFRSAAESAIVLLSLPFALVGGVWLMWLAGYHLSVAVAIGFIALAGVAAETGVVMLLYLDHSYQEAHASGALRSRDEIAAAVERGAVERVRPKLMTVTAIMAGLVPILWSEGTGADVMKRIAAPMIGGMVTSTLLTLLVIPCVYSLWKERQGSRAAPEGRAR